MNGDPRYYEAIERFSTALSRAEKLGLSEPRAVTLATANEQGVPSARIVLLRGYDERGFVFYTNSLSRKGREVAANPRAALCFFWDALKEQVRIDGQVEIISDSESDQYWERRPRLSQLASMASRQSQVLADRSVYLQDVELAEQQFAGQDVPRPEHWHGYRVVPERIEFWLGQDARMHVRTVYEVTEAGWRTYQVYP